MLEMLVALRLSHPETTLRRMNHRIDNAEDMAQQIIEVYQKPEKILQAKESLRKFNQQYCWTTMEKEYLDTVNSLISN